MLHPQPLRRVGSSQSSIDTAAAGTTSVFTGAANTKGAIVWHARMTGGAAAFANRCRLRTVGGQLELLSHYNSATWPQQELSQPVFVPAGEGLEWNNPSAVVFYGVCVYQLL